MTQDTAAAERSAHVVRGEPPRAALLAGPVVEVAPGIWKLRCVVERDNRIEDLEGALEAVYWKLLDGSDGALTLIETYIGDRLKAADEAS